MRNSYYFVIGKLTKKQGSYLLFKFRPKTASGPLSWGSFRLKRLVREKAGSLPTFY